MNALFSPSIRRMAELGLRVALGALFLGAAVGKLRDPSAFAIEIGHYEILPELAPYVAASLPMIELVLGLTLVFAPVAWRKAAALGCLALMILFTVAASSAYARGLDIDCGCFGKGTGPITWLTLVRDGALIVGFALLLAHPTPTSASSSAAHAR